MGPDVVFSQELLDAYERLLALSKRMAPRYPDLFNGVSLDDVVIEVITNFCQSPNRQKWNPKKATLTQFLCFKFKKRVLDHLKRQDRNVPYADDFSLAQTVYQSSPQKVANPNLAGLNKIIENDPEIGNFVKSAVAIEESSFINKRISERMGVPVQAVVNIKKRLKRLLSNDKAEEK